MKKHISYSELKIWSECAYKHRLKYVDRVDGFKGNEFTIFGTAVHNTCEKAVLTGSVNTADYFTHSFLKEIECLKGKGVDLDATLLEAMEGQGRRLSAVVIPAVKSYFGKYEVFSTEEPLYEKIEDGTLNFKGYIDLVLKTGDKYHIIDWKTCSWGWDARKKNNKILSYQLTLYKKYFAQKHQVGLENIETYFALLKRTAKKDHVEIFRVTSGPKKVQNALNLLKKATYNIAKENYIKNRLSCKQCEFYKTTYCN
jgi:hypothetical protein